MRRRKRMAGAGVWLVVGCVAGAVAEHVDAVTYYTQAVAQYEQQEQAQRERLETTLYDMEQIDDSIESRIDGIVKHLSKISDSTDSITKVTHLKKDAIEALQRSIRDYQARLSAAQSGYTRPTASGEKVIELSEERMMKRAEQIVTLANSFAEHRDTKAYNSYAWNNNAQHTKASRHKRTVSLGEGTREKLVEQVQAGITTLRQQNRSMQSHMQYSSPQSQASLREQIETNTRQIAHLEKLLGELMARPAARTKPVGGDEARTTSDAIDRAVQDIQQDRFVLQNLKQQYDYQASILGQTQRQLALAQQELAKHTAQK